MLVKGETMKLGEHIANLRKEQNLSQEQLAEMVGVTRQTMSNWELGVTAPNPEQLIFLAKTFHRSVDEMLGHDTSDILVQKMSNTERLVGLIIKLIKGLGILFLVFVIIDVMALCLFMIMRKETNVSSNEEVTLRCQVGDQDYLISLGSDGYFNCSNCNKKIQSVLQAEIDYADITGSAKAVTSYMNAIDGTCE